MVKRICRAVLTSAVFMGTLLLSAGCTTDMRDAFIAGVMDFVTTTTTDTLSTLVPVSDVLAGE